MEATLSSIPFSTRVLHEPQPGKSAALNTGIAASTADYIGFIDDDEELAPDWFRVVERALEAGPVDFLGGRVLPIPGSEIPTWVPPGYWAVLGTADSGLTELPYGPDFPGHAQRRECGHLPSDAGPGWSLQHRPWPKRRPSTLLVRRRGDVPEARGRWRQWKVSAKPDRLPLPSCRPLAQELLPSVVFLAGRVQGRFLPAVIGRRFTKSRECHDTSTARPFGAVRMVAHHACRQPNACTNGRGAAGLEPRRTTLRWSHARPSSAHYVPACRAPKRGGESVAVIPVVSVVLCTYNRSRLLADALHALLAQVHDTPPYEVVVVDNNSSDATRDVVEPFVTTVHRAVRIRTTSGLVGRPQPRSLRRTR